MSLQDDFRAGLTDPTRPAPAALRDGQGRPAGRRYDVYRNNVTAGLADALEAGFPVVRRIVGPEFFRQMALVHVRAHPPRSPLMMQYGQDFPAFLRGFAPVAGLPYLPAVARLELAVRDSYHAADVPGLDAAALAGVAPGALPALRLTFAPAARLVRARVPVASIWRHNALPDAPPLSGAPVEWALVTRPVYDPRVHALTPAEGAAAEHLMQGATLGAVLALAPVGLALDRVLALLLSERAITALEVLE